MAARPATARPAKPQPSTAPSEAGQPSTGQPPTARPATMTARSAWHDVPRPKVREFAAIAMAEAPALAEEILREIRREHPQLPLVLDESGEPMALVGIRRAIEVFVQHLETAEGRPTVPPGVFQEFGRGEGLNGRSLDALQAIYRMGVRLAWRRLAEIGQRVEIPPPAMYELVDAGYEYLDGLVDQSVRGYAEAAARQAGSGCGCNGGSWNSSSPNTIAATRPRPSRSVPRGSAGRCPTRSPWGSCCARRARPSPPPWGRRSCSTWSTSSPAWSCPNRTPPGAPSCCTGR